MTMSPEVPAGCHNRSDRRRVVDGFRRRSAAVAGLQWTRSAASRPAGIPGPDGAMSGQRQCGQRPAPDLTVVHGFAQQCRENHSSPFEPARALAEAESRWPSGVSPSTVAVIERIQFSCDRRVVGVDLGWVDLLEQGVGQRCVLVGLDRAR